MPSSSGLCCWKKKSWKAGVAALKQRGGSRGQESFATPAGKEARGRAKRMDAERLLMATCIADNVSIHPSAEIDVDVAVVVKDAAEAVDSFIKALAWG